MWATPLADLELAAEALRRRRDGGAPHARPLKPTERDDLARHRTRLHELGILTHGDG